MAVTTRVKSAFSRAKPCRPWHSTTRKSSLTISKGKQADVVKSGRGSGNGYLCPVGDGLPFCTGRGETGVPGRDAELMHRGSEDERQPPATSARMSMLDGSSSRDPPSRVNPAPFRERMRILSLSGSFPGPHRRGWKPVSTAGNPVGFRRLVAMRMNGDTRRNHPVRPFLQVGQGLQAGFLKRKAVDDKPSPAGRFPGQPGPPGAPPGGER